MNSEKVLIVGLQPYDAGKTTLCRALMRGFREAGIDAAPFKPHSGISYWNQFDVFQKNMKMNRLVCEDIIELEEAAQSTLPLEILNPVNRLSAPTATRHLPQERLAFEEFLAERFTHHDGTAHASVYYMKKALGSSKMRGISSYSQSMRRAGEIRPIGNFQDLVRAYDQNFDRATMSCYEHLRDRTLVVESFNDAAYPFRGAKESDVVLCVSPSTVMQLETDRYFGALEMHEGTRSKLQLTLSDIYAPSLVIDTFRIQPLTAEEQRDPKILTRNYTNIISKIVRA